MIHTIIELNDEKWFVISETTYEQKEYNYLIKINDDETDFLDEFMVVQCIKTKDGEYFDVVRDKELLLKIMPLMVPEAKEVLEDPKKVISEFF